MPLITWTGRLSTGLAEQDEQHKALIAIINRLNDAMQEGRGVRILGGVLCELAEYTEYHFGYEEDIMALYTHARVSEHRAEHARFTHAVGLFKKRFDAGSAVLTIEVMNLLRIWFFNHVLKEDKHLAQALSNGATAARPAPPGRPG